jgi:hypothetical protein
MSCFTNPNAMRIFSVTQPNSTAVGTGPPRGDTKLVRNSVMDSCHVAEGSRRFGAGKPARCAALLIPPLPSLSPLTSSGTQPCSFPQQHVTRAKNSEHLCRHLIRLTFAGITVETPLS